MTELGKLDEFDKFTSLVRVLEKLKWDPRFLDTIMSMLGFNETGQLNQRRTFKSNTIIHTNYLLCFLKECRISYL